MTKTVQIMKERREELVELLTIESGSSYIKANVEVDFCISITKEAASYPMRMGGEIVPSLVPGKENRLLRRPLGVLGVISPFNFPMYLSMRSVATALAAGNGVVLKPDEQTAMSGGTIIAKIFEVSKRQVCQKDSSMLSLPPLKRLVMVLWIILYQE